MITATETAALFRGNAGVISARRASTIAATKPGPLPAASRIGLCALRLHNTDNLLLTINVTHSQRTTSLDRSPQP